MGKNDLTEEEKKVLDILAEECFDLSFRECNSYQRTDILYEAHIHNLLGYHAKRIIAAIQKGEEK